PAYSVPATTRNSSSKAFTSGPWTTIPLRSTLTAASMPLSSMPGLAGGTNVASGTHHTLLPRGGLVPSVCPAPHASAPRLRPRLPGPLCHDRTHADEPQRDGG